MQAPPLEPAVIPEFVRDTSGIAGHPRGLSTLFFTEMWERFSYYGMKAILVLYLTASVAQGGLAYAVAKATLIAGFYNMGVYLMSLPGGWVADRFLGARRTRGAPRFVSGRDVVSRGSRREGPLRTIRR